mmetsp:Transcript_71037/g.118054  ORF Transcript_71037/g.118054 Transcript_71037/m.118054 type:complete len:942 (+) Transcript_71037:67-2892(+)
MEGSDDIIVNKFSISRGGKRLFHDSKLALIHGRRYGLIGANGCGKSTLMHVVATGEVEEIRDATPPNIDILLVEQEVEASDDITAIQMVVSADTRRTTLLAESKKLERLLNAYEMSLDEENEITPQELADGGVKFVPERDLEGEDLSKGATVRFEGRDVTVLEGKDSDGDVTIQDSSFDEDGMLASRLSEVYDELTDIGADSAEQRASAILSGLQFLEDQKGWPTSAFSGGWRMRISLARALFRKPRLLMLDEPTNHLDLHAVVWLEGYLQKWKHTLVVVSHDRDFLTTVCTDMLHCWRTKLVHYPGNYEVFEKIFKSRLEEYRQEYERQQKRLKELRKQGKASKDLGKKDGGADSASYKKQMAAVLGKNSKGKELAGFSGAADGSDAEDEMLEQITDKNMYISFNVAGEIPMPILAVDQVSFGYKKLIDGTEPPQYKQMDFLFEQVDFGLNMDSRVALVGANGTGKSTLLKLMLDELQPSVGEVRQSRSCKIGVYNQHSCDQLAAGIRLAKGEKLTPVTYLQHTFPSINVQEIRNALGRFGLEGHHHLQEISTLSGGQKSRVVFVELGLRRCHLLLLDEPTNHLDLETVDALVKALTLFKGGVLVITHNVSLINKVCNEIWVIENKSVNVFQGEFEEYRDMLAEALQEFYDEDPEEKKRERERAAAAAIKREAAAQAEDPNRPKSKAERDRERAQARAAKKAKDEADRLAKEQAEAEAAAAEAAKAAEEARLQKEAQERQLLRESSLAKAAISAQAIPLADALAQLLCTASPIEACGGLLVLCQLHTPLALIRPLVSALFTHNPLLHSDATAAVATTANEATTTGSAASQQESFAARLLTAWQQPIGWLVCRCEELWQAQSELLGAFESLCGVQQPQLLPQAALMLKAMWEAQLVAEDVLLDWAAKPRVGSEHAAARRVQKFVTPFIQWLRTAEVMTTEE